MKHTYKLSFLGTGGAFSTKFGQSNVIIKNTKTDKYLLIDCGTDIRFTLKERNINIKDIEHIFITHNHADHIGGLEYLAFASYFSGHKITLTTSDPNKLWCESLKGGLEYLNNIDIKDVNLNTYFRVNEIIEPCFSLRDSFNSIIFDQVRVPHIKTLNDYMYTDGLFLDSCDTNIKIYFTGDCMYEYNKPTAKMLKYMNMADIIFHDCENGNYKSNVHPHYDDLKKLPNSIKSKMWLYHYNDTTDISLASSDGFAGFITKDKVFYL